MQSSMVLRKTQKGRDEIATRQFHLASALRRWLVLVDGKRSVDALLKEFGGLGLDENSIQRLIAEEFVEPAEQQAAPVAAAVESAPPVEPPATDKANEDMQERFLAAYGFYNETIKATLGLRGLGLQLKVERATTIDDLLALRNAYVEAVLHAKGREIGSSLAHRLDALLGVGA